ncbi:MAG: site-specific integrase [Dehalococcoidia bacterium]
MPGVVRQQNGTIPLPAKRALAGAALRDTKTGQVFATPKLEANACPAWGVVVVPRRSAAAVSVPADLLDRGESFARTLRAEHTSPETVRAYTESVELFDRHLTDQRLSRAAAHIRREYIAAFIADLLGKLPLATANNRDRALQRFRCPMHSRSGGDWHPTTQRRCPAWRARRAAPRGACSARNPGRGGVAAR